jgi:cytochrome c oxidase subunit 3
MANIQRSTINNQEGVFVSESILDHGYMAEEHAPDPVMGHGDPTPPGKVAIWLFLASEIMFFIGLLATYIIFRSGAPKIFSEHAAVLSKTLAGINTLVLIFSSLTMALGVDAAQKGLRNRTAVCLFLTFLCACGFMGIKTIEYENKFTHHTVVARDPTDKKLYIYDGHVHGAKYTDAQFTLVGPRAAMPDGVFDIHWMSERQVEELAHMEQHEGEAAERTGKSWPIRRMDVAQDITYGPWKNTFFASYFVLTGVHGLHVLGGMVALACLLGHALRGKLLPAHTEYVGLYWHFVDLVWIFLFPCLYLL